MSSDETGGGSDRLIDGMDACYVCTLCLARKDGCGECFYTWI